MEQISRMTQDDLQGKVMEEIIKEKTKPPTSVKEPEPMMMSTQVPDYMDDVDESDQKHDRRDQILASSQFDNMLARQTDVRKSASKAADPILSAYSRLSTGKKVSPTKSFVNKSTRFSASPKK
jgi:hypothetical protein